MSRRAWPDQLATLAFGLAVVAFAWAIVDAVRLAPAGDGVPPNGETTRNIGNAGNTRDTTPLPDIGVAVSRNVFSPARRAPAVPYRLLVADVATAMTGEGMDRDRVDPVVLGTAVGVNGSSFAMCSYDDAPAVVVRVGDQLGPYTVVSIARGRVVFRDVEGNRLEVESPTSPDGDLP